MREPEDVIWQNLLRRMAERFLSILGILWAKVVLTRRWVWTVISFVHDGGFYYYYFFLRFLILFRTFQVGAPSLPMAPKNVSAAAAAAFNDETSVMDPPTFAGR